MNELNLTVTEERIQDTPLEIFYFVEKASPKVLIDFVAQFVTNEKGEYLPHDEAVKKVIEGRKLSDLESIAEQLKDAIEGTLVPNG